MQAVILAAGMGSRIRDIHTLPKGFIRLGEQALIERSIRHLHAYGIHDILIVTGFESAYYEQLKEKYDHCQTIFNPYYHCYSSLYSLYCAKDFVTDDFLLLESDIIYEKRAIENLLGDSHKNTILLSGETLSSDEVYVEARAQKLICMSKQKNALQAEHILGEFVGINKISRTAYFFLIQQLMHNEQLLKNGYYDEQGLVVMTQLFDIHCLKMNDLLWGEIDNAFQLERVQKLYPEICKRDIQIMRTCEYG